MDSWPSTYHSESDKQHQPTLYLDNFENNRLAVVALSEQIFDSSFQERPDNRVDNLPIKQICSWMEVADTDREGEDQA